MRPVLPSLPALPTLHPVRLFAHAFNLLTQQQPWAAERLAEYAGQTLRVCLGEFQATLTIQSNGHLVQADAASVPDVVLELIPEKLSLGALLSSTARPDLARWVKITGQAALAQVVSDLARNLRPDPEDALAHWLGDLPARRLVQGARSAAAAAESFGRGLSENIAEYLSEESGALAGVPALAVLGNERVQTLHRLAQLEQRQAALQVRLQRFKSLADASR